MSFAHEDFIYISMLDNRILNFGIAHYITNLTDKIEVSVRNVTICG